jgi:hypothetical protein
MIEAGPNKSKVLDFILLASRIMRIPKNKYARFDQVFAGAVIYAQRFSSHQ